MDKFCLNSKFDLHPGHKMWKQNWEFLSLFYNFTSMYCFKINFFFQILVIFSKIFFQSDLYASIYGKYFQTITCHSMSHLAKKGPTWVWMWCLMPTTASWLRRQSIQTLKVRRRAITGQKLVLHVNAMQIIVMKTFIQNICFSITH